MQVGKGFEWSTVGVRREYGGCVAVCWQFCWQLGGQRVEKHRVPEGNRLEARVGIEGRPPSALLLRAQFRLYYTGSAAFWQDRPSSALAAPFQRSLTEESTEGKMASDAAIWADPADLK
jgi:hypothetical protein